MRRVTLSPLLLSLLILLTVTVSSTNAQGETVRIVVYRSADSLTLYLPDAGFPDITGLYIQATTAVGETVRRDLALLPAFRGLPYNRLPAPICFQIISVSSATLPLDCQTITTLTQLMAAGDVFWHEQGDRTLIFYLGEIPQICPAGAPRCTLVFPALPTPTPTATNTPTNTATATATTTATFTPTNTTIFTFTPASTDTPMVTPAPTPVTRNEDWAPVEQDFDGVTMVLVPASCFDMGNDPDAYNLGSIGVPDGGRQCFDEPFWIDQTEVTNGQYGSSGSSWSGDNLPRVRVTWFQARHFCESRDARLPTEVEWEYAARGPSGWMYPWGNDWEENLAVRNPTSSQHAANVGSIPAGASWVGAMDMSGNVWEWVSSLYQPYPIVEGDGREADTGYSTDVQRMLRGGSWFYSDPANLRAAVRVRGYPDNMSDYYGFRCARSS